MTKPPHRAADCHGLDGYLRGDLAPSRPGEAITEPLRFLIVERFGYHRPNARALITSGEVPDPGLAHAWYSSRLICLALSNAPQTKRGQRVAEQTAVTQMGTLYELAWERIDRLNGAAAFWMEEVGDVEIVSVLSEWRLLAEVLALCLWECGDERARRDIRDLVAERLNDTATSELHPNYVRVFVGLSQQPTRMWSPGRGATGELERALENGQEILLSAMPDVIREDSKTGALLREQLAAARARDAVAGAALRKIEGGEPSSEPEALQIDEGPSLLVLASVQHLPGAAEDGKGKPGSSTGYTARAEWAPYAGRRLRLAQVPDLAEARATLVDEFPDDAAIVDAILLPLAGRAYVHVPPTLLLGPPGTGKSRFARRLGEILGLAVTVYSCGGVADSSLIGTSRQWSTGRACVPLQSIKKAASASVLMVLDEISRAGTRLDNGRLVDGVLALTETETARAYQDPFLECAVDLSAVSWLATANTVAGLDPALLSRFRVLEMGPRTAASLPSLTRGILSDIRRERGLDEVWLPAPDAEESAVLAEHWQGGSVRRLRRLIETLLASREQTATRM